MSWFFYYKFLALEEKENDSQITASQQDTNGFAKIPKLIETNDVPILNSNILIKWAHPTGARDIENRWMQSYTYWIRDINWNSWPMKWNVWMRITWQFGFKLCAVVLEFFFCKFKKCNVILFSNGVARHLLFNAHQSFTKIEYTLKTSTQI